MVFRVRSAVFLRPQITKILILRNLSKNPKNPFFTIFTKKPTQKTRFLDPVGIGIRPHFSKKPLKTRIFGLFAPPEDP